LAKLTRITGPRPHLVRWRDLEGHQRRRTFELKEDAEVCLAAAIQEEARRRAAHRMGKHSQPTARSATPRRTRPRMTLREFGPVWLDTLDIEPETRSKYEGTFFAWTYRLLGHVQLRLVAEQDVAELDLQMRNKGLSTARRRDVMLCFRSMMEEALRQGLVTTNVVSDYYKSRNWNLPSGKRARMPMPFTEQERPRLYKALGLIDALWELFARLSIGTGLRPGEARALRIRHFDFDRLLIRIENNATRKGRIKKTKEETDDLLTLTPGLARRVMKCIESRGLEPNDLLFGNKAGKPFDPGNFRDRVWIPALKAANLEGHWVEDLRHTTASMLIDAGADIVKVSRFMRHKKESTTLDHYAHLFPGGLDGIREKMIQLIDDEDEG
jgi:integrase